MHFGDLTSVHWNSVVRQDTAAPELAARLVAVLALAPIWVRLEEDTLAFDLRCLLLHLGVLVAAAIRSFLGTTLDVELVVIDKFE